MANQGVVPILMDDSFGPCTTDGGHDDIVIVVRQDLQKRQIVEEAQSNSTKLIIHFIQVKNKKGVLTMRGRGIVPGPHQECCLRTRPGIGLVKPLLNAATVVSVIVGLTLLLCGEMEKAETFYEGTKFLGVWAGGCVLIDCVMVVIGGIDYLLSNDENYTDPIRNSMRQRAATAAGTYGYGLRTTLESETEFVTGGRGSRRANDAYETQY